MQEPKNEARTDRLRKVGGETATKIGLPLLGWRKEDHAGRRSCLRSSWLFLVCRDVFLYVWHEGIACIGFEIMVVQEPKLLSAWQGCAYQPQVGVVMLVGEIS
jgi:hypothetical protein